MWLGDKCLYNVSNRADRCAVQRMTLITQAALAHRVHAPRAVSEVKHWKSAAETNRVFVKAQEFNKCEFWPVVVSGGNQGNS